MNRLLKSAYDAFPFKKQAFLFLKLFFSPGHDLQERLNFGGPFRVNVPGGHFIMQNYDGHDHVIENEVFWNGLAGNWEKHSLSLWMKLCASAETIVDIGANTGIYSLVAKAIRPTAQVYAFEPVERIFAQLRHNMALNNFDVVCLNAAVSDIDGTRMLFDGPGAHTYTASMDPSFIPNAVGTKVITTTLSTFLRERRLESIDLMKIDVEKHEYEVLAGAAGLFGSKLPSMLIEILTDELGGKIEQLLAGSGYVYNAIDETRGPFRCSMLRGTGAHNYLLCSAEKAKALGLEHEQDLSVERKEP